MHKLITHVSMYAQTLYTSTNLPACATTPTSMRNLQCQIVYYFYGYFRWLDDVPSRKLGDTVNFVVPTGNFGNSLAGFYAREVRALHATMCTCLCLSSTDRGVVYSSGDAVVVCRGVSPDHRWGRMLAYGCPLVFPVGALMPSWFPALTL